MPPFRTFPVLLAVVLLAHSAPAPVEAQSGEWQAFVHGFIHDYFTHQPPSGVWAGRHEFDGLLPDWTPAGIRRYTDWLRVQRHHAGRQFEDADLTAPQKLEREHLLNVIESELFEYEGLRAPFTNPLFYTSDLSPDVYTTREYAPLGERLRAFTRHCEAIPTALSRMEHNLELPLVRSHIETAIQVLDGLASYFGSDVPGIYAGVDDPELQDEFAKANREAVDALKESVSWLKENLPTATEDYALGKDRFLEMLQKSEGVSIDLAELERAGNLDLQRNLTSLESACGEVAPGASLSDCVRQVQSRKPSGGAVEGARAQLADLKQFIIDKDLVSIPGSEEALVEEAPPYARWNFAYIDTPGPEEEGLPSIYYIAPPDPEWPREEQEAYVPGRSSLLFVSVHEVWPGHFLHFLHANRGESMLASIFSGYSYSEGWAHYTEQMMWDAGLGDGDPEIHVGQLLNALIRNVRYLSAIGLHTGGMTVEESERMFREKAFQDPGNARQQAVRGTFDPGYLNYTLGKLMIMKLREDWTADRGGQAAWNEFHDAFLSYGGGPIPLIRRAMLGSGDGDEALLPVNE